MEVNARKLFRKRMQVIALILLIYMCQFSSSTPSHAKVRQKEHMVYIPSGKFWMGADLTKIEDAKPIHSVQIRSFWMDKTEVTNKAFDKFVHATGYKTFAEKYGQTLFDKPGAFVFTPPASSVPKDDSQRWWRYKVGASWKHPEGPRSNISHRWNHPVVDITWEDANAYAKWIGKRLPTEAEFEYAARGGLSKKQFAWGNDLKTGERWMANIWQGEFPHQNTKDDGFVGTAPVGSFPSNGYGLLDMTGNVWEWCSDWYRPNYGSDNEKVLDNPNGPQIGFDPTEPHVPKKVLRGGSFLCTDTYCSGYLVGARNKGSPSTAACNVGFRCVRDYSN